MQNIINDHKKRYGDLHTLPEYAAIHINDTHPALCVPELMRLLMDEYGMGWDDAWAIVTKTFAYTNHTILAEAIEKWPIDIFQNLLPRIYQIVEEINRRFTIELREKYPEDYAKQNRMSIIQNGMIHMAWLAIHGCFSVNGVAALHTELLKTQELADWYGLYPAKFNNKTNGITQRRWLLSANPRLAKFITDRIGHGWEKDLSKLRELEKFADDEKSLNELLDINGIKASFVLTEYYGKIYGG